MSGIVYVLHFDPPYPRDARGSAGHYVGWCNDGSAQRRLEQHTSPLVKAVKAAGSTVTITYEAKGTRNDERRMKRQRHPERYCSVCKEAKNGRSVKAEYSVAV